MESISILSIITIAFLGSFGHCVGMCGGIVIAYTTTKVNNSWSKQKQSLSHVLYSFGRITTYTILGAIFGALGSLSLFSQKANAIFLILVGIIMLLVGISISGKFKFLTLIEHSLSQNIWYKNTFRKLLSSDSLKSFYLLGALNGLLPCGFVYVFIIMALGTSSFVYGALVMFIFGLSTIPALFSLGFFIGLFKQNTYRALFIKIASILVVFFALHTIYKGYMFFPSV
ncbi:MAG: sulfite exporter TauE/SafE family protein [Campylobacteraceae bacterium]|nr:sulfite exporter TauE/SafE family protein [Campylobacteraceae bacterium]